MKTKKQSKPSHTSILKKLDDVLLNASDITQEEREFIIERLCTYAGLRVENEELLEMVKEMYSAITNGHSLKFTHEEYKEAIAKVEGE